MLAARRRRDPRDRTAGQWQFLAAAGRVLADGPDDIWIMLNLIRPLPSVHHCQQEALAHEILNSIAYDFGPLCESSSAFTAQPERRGVRVVVLPTDGLPEPAIEALLAWRLGQYLLAGFYDAERTTQLRWRHEPREF